MADIERGKAAVRRLFTEGMAQGSSAVIDEVVTANAMDHHRGVPGDVRSHLTVAYRGLHQAFPDLEPDITNMVGEGDTVATRVVIRGTHDGPLDLPGMPRALPPTHRRIELEQFHFLKVDDDGRIVYHWGALGEADLMRQLGAGGPQPAAAR